MRAMKFETARFAALTQDTKKHLALIAFSPNNP